MIDKIPADENTVMTPLLRRAFLMEECDPACHCCDKDIADGDNFKLASVPAEDEWNGTFDIMLCTDCTKANYTIHMERKREAAAEATRQRMEIRNYSPYGGRGFSRPHLEKTTNGL